MQRLEATMLRARPGVGKTWEVTLAVPTDISPWLVPDFQGTARYIREGRGHNARIYPLDFCTAAGGFILETLTDDPALGAGTTRVWLGWGRARHTSSIRHSQARPPLHVLLVGEGMEQAALIRPGRLFLESGARVTGLLIGQGALDLFAHRYLAAGRWVFAVPGGAIRPVLRALCAQESVDAVWVCGPARLRRAVRAGLGSDYA